MAAKLRVLVVAICLFEAHAVQWDVNDGGSDPPDEAALEEAALEEARNEVPAQAVEDAAPEVPAQDKAVNVVKPEPEKMVVSKGFKVSAQKAVKQQVSSQPHFLVPKGVPAAPVALPHTSELTEAVTDLFKLGDFGLDSKDLSGSPFTESVEKINEVINYLMPKVKEAHAADQQELNRLGSAMGDCDAARDGQQLVAKPAYKKYEELSRKHKTCRAGEASLMGEKNGCWEDEADKKKLKELKCKEFAIVEANFESQVSNRGIVTKQQGETSEIYIKRISSTFCGQKGGDGQGGYGKDGFVDAFVTAKEACEKATRDYDDGQTKCQKKDDVHAARQQLCDSYQDQMDAAACKYAVDIKDSCEKYSECFTSRRKSYDTALATIKINEEGRKHEWAGYKRMVCLVTGFSDGKMKKQELTDCREQKHSVEEFTITYPTLASGNATMAKCEVPKEYPSTAAYKKAQFAPLPPLAKGKVDANECTGIEEISTKPAEGSPETCKCERVTMNGHYSPGPVVKCTGCLDVSQTSDKNSCPDGTKLFAPRTRSDWKTFFASAQPLRAPNWIVDITRPEDGCTDCIGHAMNSDNAKQKSWVTQDGAPWWLRSDGSLTQPSGDYAANCYMDLSVTPGTSEISFDDNTCNYHSKSYYCQPVMVSTTPNEGSPIGCKCDKVAISGSYSAKVLVKCEGCLDVNKATQKNSCPVGTKIFSPASREDWRAVIGSVAPLRSPHWIIDVTRPKNGCSDCTEHAMHSDARDSKTWVTSDGSPWWLRTEKFSQPSGDYEANCYMAIEGEPTEDNVRFDDDNCNYHSTAYYCQPAKK